MIERIRSIRDVRRFVTFGVDHYRGDPHYVPPIISVLTRELVRETIVKRTSVGLMSRSGGVVRGRLLYAFAEDRKRSGTTCYFSFFEAVDDDRVAAELFCSMEDDMRSHGVVHAEGAYAPYDPDTRRGILVAGFDDDPSFLLSYNKPYYGPMLERLGYAAVVDTVTIGGADNPDAWKLLESLGDRFDAKHDVSVDPLDFRHLDRDLRDVHAILAQATTALNYEQPPSLAMIAAVAKNLRFFLDPGLVLIARRKDDATPLGFVLVVPDFNEVLKRTKGRIRPLVFLIGRKRIRRARAMMQYVVPDWQNTGLIFRLYRGIHQRMRERGMTRLEGGTIVERNVKSFGAFLKLGCRITKTMRIYGKDLIP